MALLGPIGPALFAGPQITSSQLKAHFDDRRFSVVIVPGHDPVYPGTAFKGYTEAEVNVKLGQYLKEYLDADGHFSVSITRDLDGEYAPWFSGYVTQHRKEIESFMLEKKTEMQRAFETGEARKVSGVEHNDAPVSTRLYLWGVNKFGNDTNADLLLHIHFNDYPHSNTKVPGKYTGFAIYVPESQFGNATATRPLADALRNTLSQVIPGSNHPKEAALTVEDQELVAIGSNNQRSGPSLLIEYSYIYEAPLRVPALRDVILREYAYQTYRGLLAYLEPRSLISMPESTILPYHFDENILPGSSRARDILALQYVLKKEGVYPPQGRSFSDCPLTGIFGECVKRSLIAFQKKNSLEAVGYVDRSTRDVLNGRYSN